MKQRNGGYGEVEKVEALVLLLAAGGDCLDDIRILQADEGLSRLVGRELPSADTLRHFLYQFHDEALVEAAKRKCAPGTVAYIPEENAALRGLGHVNQALVRAVAAQRKGRRATLDHDATIQESQKREALFHYKGGRSYQPACVYWAEQDLIVGDEYRDGNLLAGMQNLGLMEKAFGALPASVTERFFRADSACYESEVLKWLSDEERPTGPRGRIGFTISADMTPELRRLCESVAEADFELVEERATRR